MNDIAMSNRKTVIFMVAMFVCAFSIGTAAAADKSKMASGSDTKKQPSYAEYPGEIGDIAKQAEAEVKEVNEGYEREKEKFEAIRREQYLEEYKEEPAKSLLSNDDIAALEAARSQNEKAIRTKAGYDINSLEVEQKARQKVSTTGPGPRHMSQTSILGMIKGIVFYENNGAALIAGEVVREGDVLLGVKIVKISPDFVEFDKQGNQWKQEVGQSPPAAVWEQPQTPAPDQRPSTETKVENKSSK